MLAGIIMLLKRHSESGDGRRTSPAERPPDPVYPIVYLDALLVKMRQEGRVENRAIFVALSVYLEGHKVLGL